MTADIIYPRQFNSRITSAQRTTFAVMPSRVIADFLENHRLTELQKTGWIVQPSVTGSSICKHDVISPKWVPSSIAWRMQRADKAGVQ